MNLLGDPIEKNHIPFILLVISYNLIFDTTIVCKVAT